jgi:hypothetical protein
MIDDVAGLAGHNINYETGHQLEKPSSVFSAKISAIRMALFKYALMFYFFR